MIPTAGHLDHHAALAGCARGELWALRVLVQAEGGKLNAMVLRIVGDAALAEQVLKQALLQVFRDANRYDPRIGSARGWIFAVVRQVALTRRRREEAERAFKARQSNVVSEPAPVADGQPDPMILAFFDGYTPEQIAGRCQASAAVVREWIRGGLHKLMDAPV